MGKVHICLKRSFIGVTNAIAIFDAVILGHLIADGHLPDGQEVEHKGQMYFLTVTPLVLIVFGLFGVCKMKKWALIVFTIGMILVDGFWFISAAAVFGLKSQMVQDFRNQYLDVGPLSESQEFQQNLSEKQKKFHCCGLAQGYKDWDHDIPDTCECTVNSTSNPCPCLPYLVEQFEWFLTVVGGALMAISFLWMLSVVLSIVILCKLSQKEDAPAVVYHTGEN